MAGEELPYLASVRFDRRIVKPLDAKIFQLDALRIEHAEDVVVRLDEERRRVWKGLVVGKPARIGMAMR